MCVTRGLQSSSQSCRLSQPQLTVMAPVVPVSSPDSNKLIQGMKPKLSRKLTPSAKINLNNYWNIFESLMHNRSEGHTPVIECNKPTTTTGQTQYVHFDVDMDNESNENVNNENLENSQRAGSELRHSDDVCSDCLARTFENVRVDEDGQYPTRPCDQQVTEL